MCLECEQTILRHIHVGDTYTTANGLSFTVIDIQGDKIYLMTSSGGEKWFHIRHAGMCLHWMKVGGNVIESVSSIRRLVGEGGILEECDKCERNPAYIWGILRDLPGVQRGRRNELFYREIH